MNTVLITAYAVNPFKGSEDGMGWNFILQAARFQKVIAVTRKNNAPPIAAYRQQHPEWDHVYANICFLYFDWPQWLLGWKKGPLLSMIYFYAWQLSVAIWLWRKKLPVDIVHNLNFHNDWTPSFLWITGKPFVWGPVGHHPPIPRRYLQPVYGTKAWVKDRLLWMMKKAFWYADPFLFITARRANKILCMNTAVPRKLHLSKNKYVVIPSVAAGHQPTPVTTAREGFTVLSAGRFISLKGFDLSIQAFTRFYRQLPSADQLPCKMVLVGTGPALPLLKALIEENDMQQAITIRTWVARQEMDELYKKAAVFLFPSHEGAGMVVAEAMSFGLPVVCLDNEGPGAFLHPRSALKVRPGTYREVVQELAGRLRHLYADAAFYQLEQQLGRLRFDEHLCWDVRGPQLKTIYDSLLAAENLTIPAHE